MQTYLEVANHDAFRQHMESNPLTEDDEKALAGLGL
jgi:MraZ protein